MSVRGEQQPTTGCSPADGLKGFAATEAVAQRTPVDCWNFSGPLILHSTPVWLNATWAILVRLLDYKRVDSRCARDWNWNVKSFSGGSASFCFSFFFPWDPPAVTFYFIFSSKKKLAYFILCCSFWNRNVPERPMEAAAAGRHGYISDVFLLSSQTWIKTCGLFLYEY